MNIRKIVTILNYLSLRVNYLTKLKVSKLLYIADKEHFIRCGRFITNDRYVKMKNGPVPTRILNIINEPDIYIAEPSNRRYLKHNISFSKDNKRIIKSNRRPDLNELSNSEIQVLDKIIKKYGKLHISKLVDITHNEFAWINASDAGFLSTKDIVHEIKEGRKQELLKVYEEYKNEDIELKTIFC